MSFSKFTVTSLGIFAARATLSYVLDNSSILRKIANP